MLTYLIVNDRVKFKYNGQELKCKFNSNMLNTFKQDFYVKCVDGIINILNYEVYCLLNPSFNSDNTPNVLSTEDILLIKSIYEGN